MKIDIDVNYWNNHFRDKDPDTIITWALGLSDRNIVTTSFGKHSAVLLSTFARMASEIDIIWCDSGYNLPETYAHAQYLIERFDLNMNVYVPKLTKAFIDHQLGFPSIENPNHEVFSEIVKLEPFRRAMNEHQPDVWFTNIRVRKTEYRDSKDILSLSKDGVLKVSPFYYWSDDDLDNFLERHSLPKNSTYFDPVKALETRECGIHLQ